MWKVKSSEFLLSAAHVKQLPTESYPEFAVIGRSNAGKSTLVNNICGRRALARVSGTPGKTQQVNLYHLVITNGVEDRIVRLADLPGYGYARVSKSIRGDLAKLVVNYFEQREQLKLVFMLSDIKRQVNETDVELRNFIAGCERSVQVVLTKADKANQSEKIASQRYNSTKFGLESADLLLSSINQGADKILETAVTLLF